MRWLYITIALLAASACLVGWIYLRDRDTNWRPPERHLAPIPNHRAQPWRNLAIDQSQLPGLRIYLHATNLGG